MGEKKGFGYMRHGQGEVSRPKDYSRIWISLFAGNTETADEYDPPHR
ncbi:hypothetical protein NIES970_28210 (plasmid) [[Synechococcus] sp. NIES-970]|nr:hypothetical protein NIES970_28210 [[Synechococcus] sp. NIES-970]